MNPKKKDKTMAHQALPQVAQPAASNRVFKMQIAFIASLCILLYANTLTFNYTLDDTLMITANDYTKLGIRGIPEILSTDAFAGFLGKDKNLLPGGRYRPLSHIMFAVEYELFGLNPLPAHLINILLYALGCLLVFLVMRRLMKDFPRANVFLSIPFVAAVLFAAHPLHTEVVANIKGRDEILGMILVFLSLLFADKWLERPKPAYFILVVLFYFLALLAKENTFTFLAVIPLTLWFFRKPHFSKLITLMVMPGISALVYLLLRVNALGTEVNNVVVTELLNDPFLNASVAERYATVFYTWLIYIKLLVFPHPLTHDYYPYHIAITNFSNGLVWLSLAIYGFLLVFALKYISKRNLIAYGILFYALIFSISSNLFFNIGAFMNERFVFLSLLGFTLILAFLLLEKLKSKGAGLIILIILLSAFSLKTFTRNYAWKDDFTLFTTDVKTSVNSAKVNVSAGGMLIEKAQKEPNKVKKEKYLSQATTYLRKGLEIHPTYTAGWVLLGNAYLEQRQLPASYTCYDNAIKLGPENKDAVNNMTVLLSLAAVKMDYSTAEKSSRRLMGIYPDSINFRYELASALMGQGKADTSKLILEQILQAKPDYYMALCKMGELYGRYMNRIDISEDYLLRSAAINSSWLPAQENLGIVYAMKGQFQKSRVYFLRALELDEKQSRIHKNISLTYLQMGDTLNAGIHKRRAEELELQEL